MHSHNSLYYYTLFIVNICIIIHGYTQIGKIGEILKLKKVFSGIGLPHIPNIRNLNLTDPCVLICLKTKRLSNNSGNSISWKTIYYLDL